MLAGWIYSSATSMLASMRPPAINSRMAWEGSIPVVRAELGCVDKFGKRLLPVAPIADFYYLPTV